MSLRPTIPAFALAALTLAALPAAAAPSPQMPIESFAQLQTPLPYPYDEHASPAEASRVVAAARRRALKEHKLLLIDMGGNWCADCRILAATMQVEPLKAFVAQHFVLVMIDAGRFDKNMQIPAAYGIHNNLKEGVPALLVVDPRTNNLLDADRVSAVQDARSMTPQALADWIAQWAR